jgi:hypothetical protein
MSAGAGDSPRPSENSGFSRPRFSSSTDDAISASRGAERVPAPTRSSNRAPNNAARQTLIARRISGSACHKKWPPGKRGAARLTLAHNQYPNRRWGPGAPNVAAQLLSQHNPRGTGRRNQQNDGRSCKDHKPDHDLVYERLDEAVGDPERNVEPS